MLPGISTRVFKTRHTHLTRGPCITPHNVVVSIFPFCHSLTTPSKQILTAKSRYISVIRQFPFHSPFSCSFDHPLLGYRNKAKPYPTPIPIPVWFHLPVSFLLGSPLSNSRKAIAENPDASPATRIDFFAIVSQSAAPRIIA